MTDTLPATAVEWSADWITDPASAKDRTPRTLYFRREIDVPATVTRATVRASALGWYRLFVNTDDITGHALVPRWMSFDHEVEFQEYDVAHALREGGNVLGVIVGEGRFRGRNGGGSTPAMFGKRLAMLLQLEIDFADGTSATITSDDAWRVGAGRIRSADPKFGERVDLRISDTGWLNPGARTEAETAAVVLPTPSRRLVPEDVGRVTAVDRRAGVVTRAPSGMQLIDFGQNFTGVARTSLPAGSGRKVTILYAEVLTPGGELETDYFEAEKKGSFEDWFQRDEVILAETAQTYTPSLTFRGFRYVGVLGLTEDLRPTDVEGIVLSTEMASTGEFTCSDPRLDRLHENVVWSLRSNFLDTATDCPTRERSGWTGDLRVFAATAAILTDCAPFLRRYLHNVAIEQLDDGRVPAVIPHEKVRIAGFDLFNTAGSSVGWGDIAVELPLTLHTYFGDQDILRRQYPSARRWVEFLLARAGRGNRVKRARLGSDRRFVIDRGYDFGEWLRPGESGLKSILHNVVHTNSAVATAYLARSASMLAQTAALVGEHADADRYRKLSMDVARAWRAAFVSRGGARIADDRQDDYVRALAFDLLENDQKAPAIARLVELIEQADDHLGTGFLSTPLLLSTLTDHGRADVAFRILMQTTSPSWLSQVERGATTTWETWEGYRPDGRAKESHNHYAFGAVAQWLHEYVAGLRPAEPGYRRILVSPNIGGGLTSASSRIQTPFGSASSSWRVEGESVRLQVLLPPGTAGTVISGDGSAHEVGEGRHEFSWTPPRREAA